MSSTCICVKFEDILAVLSCTVLADNGESLDSSRFLLCFWNHETVFQMHIWNNLRRIHNLWIVFLLFAISSDTKKLPDLNYLTVFIIK